MGFARIPNVQEFWRIPLLGLRTVELSKWFRKRELNVLFSNHHRFNLSVEVFADPIDAFFDDRFRSTRAGGDEYIFHAFEPLRLNVAGSIDQIGRDSRFGREFTQAVDYWNCFGFLARGKVRLVKRSAARLLGDSASHSKCLLWADSLSLEIAREVV